MNEIADCKNVKAAANAAAGNWQNWSSFVWFGERETPEPHNVYLFYTLGHDYTIADLTNHEILETVVLKPYLGDLQEGATADHFGSTAHGDMKLKGFAVRVYDEAGEITPAFKALHEAARTIKTDRVLDERMEKVINRREWLRWLNGDLPYLCKQYGVEYKEEMLTSFTDHITKEEELNFDHLDSDEIEEIFCNLYNSEIHAAQHERTTKLFMGVAEKLPEFIKIDDISSESPGAPVTMSVDLPRLDEEGAEPDHYDFYMGGVEDHFDRNGKISCCFHGEDLRHDNELVSKIPNVCDDVDRVAAWVKETLTKRQKRRPIDNDPTPKYRIVLEVETKVDPNELRWNIRNGSVAVKEITPIEEEN